MSKTETVRRLSAEQSKPARQQAKTEAEAQRELSRIVEQMADDLTALTEDQKKVLRGSAKAIKVIGKQTEKAGETIEEAIFRVESAASSLRWKLAVVSGVAGLVIGVGLVFTFLIWQPQWLEHLWLAADRIGTTGD